MSDTPAVRVPASVFHPTQIIADEAIARDWSIWDFVDRVGTLNAPRDVLAFELWAACGPLDPMARMGDDFPMDMERVFGISAEMWRRTIALCKQYPERVEPLDDVANEWYGFTD